MSFKTLHDVIALSPYDGSGNYVRVTDWTNDRDAGIKIMADRHDNQDDDFASALTNAITRDGQSQVTADIPLNGHRLTGVGDAVNPQDAVTLKQAQAIKTFSTALTLSGNNVDGRLNFTGTQVTGISFSNPQIDMGFGTRAVSGGVKKRFVWNTKADFSGPEAATLFEDGMLRLGPTVAPSIDTQTSLFASYAVTAHGNYSYNLYYDPAGAAWRSHTVGWGATLSFDEASGLFGIYRTSSSSTGANQARGLEALMIFNTAKQVTFPAAVFAASAFLDVNGNVSGPNPGSVWLNYGTGNADAYSAITNRIEARAAAFAATRISNTQMAGLLEDQIGGGPTPTWYENSGYVMTGFRRSGNDSYAFRRRQPQVSFNGGASWLTAFPF